MQINCVRNEGICINYVNTKYLQGKRKLRAPLVLISMLFVHIFVHTKEYNRSTQVGVEPVIAFIHAGMDTLGIYPEDIYPEHFFF